MRGLRKRNFHGEPWARTCQHIVDTLPQQVCVSFDIDGLDPALCPETGTPVPGGLTWDGSAFLLDMVVDSGRRVIGFGSGSKCRGNAEWDAIVGAGSLFPALSARRAEPSAQLVWLFLWDKAGGEHRGDVVSGSRLGVSPADQSGC